MILSHLIRIALKYQAQNANLTKSAQSRKHVEALAATIRLHLSVNMFTMYNHGGSVAQNVGGVIGAHLAGWPERTGGLPGRP